MKRNGKNGALSDDDLALWRKVTERTEKLDLNSLFTPAIDGPRPSGPALRRAKAAVFDQPKAKPRSRAHLKPSMPDLPDPKPAQMDKKAFVRLKRGKLKPEGRLDLHGMTMDRAHPALTRFIMSSHRNGKRLVLVITGKGKTRDEGGPIPVRNGVLRHQVPLWLSMAPLSSVVMNVSQSHISHGGDGAYYIYLRRNR